MSDPSGPAARMDEGIWRRLAFAIVAAAAVGFFAANAHLIYVAFQSQPDCIPHSKPTSGDAASAARSSC